MNYSVMTLPREDVDALVEACIMDGYPFGTITKEIRTEWPECGVRQAITEASASVSRFVRDGGALGAAAQRIVTEWNEKYTKLPIGLG